MNEASDGRRAERVRNVTDDGKDNHVHEVEVGGRRTPVLALPSSVGSFASICVYMPYASIIHCTCPHFLLAS